MFLQANLAKWEPRHGKFRYRHPWSQYLEIGGIARDYAYRIQALNAYLSYETQVIIIPPPQNSCHNRFSRVK